MKRNSKQLRDAYKLIIEFFKSHFPKSGTCQLTEWDGVQVLVQYSEDIEKERERRLARLLRKER
jgi:hypothetical protein